MRLRGSWSALALTMLLAATTAGADESRRAEQLFRDGLEGMLAGQHEKACPMLQESFELEPLPGAAFTLAECYFGWAKWAQAHLTYGRYLHMFDALPDEERGKQEGRDERAKQQLAELEQKVSRITLALPADAPASTRVTANGEPVAAGTERAFDPATVRFVVTLPTGEQRDHVHALSAGERRTIELELPESVDPEQPRPADPPIVFPMRTWALLLGGLGAANLVVGAIAGGVVIGEKSTIDEQCEGNLCSPEGLDAANSAQTVAAVSTVAFAIGIAALGGGTALWFLAPDEQSTTGSVRVRPLAAPTHGGAYGGVELSW